MNRRSAMLPVALIAALAGGCGAPDPTGSARRPEKGGGNWLASFLVPSQTVTIDAGTELVVRLDAPVSTATHHVGDSVRARLTEPVLVGGQVVLESGARVFGRVIELDLAGRVGGRARLGVEFSGIGTPTGMTDILASYRIESKGQPKKEAGAIGGAPTGGAILGRVDGHHDEDASGTALGAGVGTIAIAATNKRPQAALPAGSMIVLTLGAPAEVRLRT